MSAEYIPRPLGCDYISRAGQCFTQAEEFHSALLGIAIGVAVVVIVCLLLRRA